LFNRFNTSFDVGVASIAMASLWGYAEAIPYTLTIFPEGTRLTEAKLVDSQEMATPCPQWLPWIQGDPLGKWW
jgi:hypothetical protein